MFERFTDRARKVMGLANQEAQRFNHEYVGTEHLLLGLIKEGEGVATKVFKSLNIDLRKVRFEVEKLVKTGPDMTVMGKLPQTPRAKKVIEFAIEESRNLNHNYVGTEHLLLGIIKEGEGVAAQVLNQLGLKFLDARDELLNILGTEECLSPSLDRDDPLNVIIIECIRNLAREFLKSQSFSINYVVSQGGAGLVNTVPVTEFAEYLRKSLEKGLSDCLSAKCKIELATDAHGLGSKIDLYRILTKEMARIISEKV